MSLNDDAISQAEIDALVRGMMGQDESKASSAPGGGGAINNFDMDLLKGTLQQAVEASGAALGDLVGIPCSAKLIDVTPTTLLGVGSLFSGQILAGQATLISGLNGAILFVVPNILGLAMITQLYGGVAPSYLDESALGALAEGLTQMTQASMAKVGDQLGRPVSASPVEAKTVNSLTEMPGVSPSMPVMAVGFDLAVGDSTGRMLMIIAQESTDAIVQGIKVRQAAKARPAESKPSGQSSQQPGAHVHYGGARDQGGGTDHHQAASQSGQVPYQSANFPDLAYRVKPEEIRNIELLLDVTLQVTVELGRTRRQIRDVLAMGPGSVVELDKLAGEQVDVLVNGKLIAKGEVVVIDENYGVRITDIISPADRVQSLK